MRLQKYMAQSGVASRRKSEEIIKEGRVKVNNKIIRKLGTTINPKKDIVMVDGKEIKIEHKDIYIMLNKPTGYVTTLKSKHNKDIVIDLITGIDERIFPVGRLDQDSSGLLLMTNDGNLTHKLTHPSYEIIKKYIVLVEGIPDSKKLSRFRKGLEIDGKITARAYIKILKKKKDASILEISIHEGRNRQVRKMCEHIGHPVIELKRIALANLTLGSLKPGEWRYLTGKEVSTLKNM